MIAIRRAGARAFLLGLPFAAACTFLFWPTFRWMANRFDSADSFYSHGWLIPLASAWLVWHRRERLRRLSPRASYGGLALLIPAAAVHVLATWWSINVVSGFALVAAAWGLVWTLWGRPVVWALRFPLLFLLFMVPLPGVLLISISFYLKLLAASLATPLLRLIGIPATQGGSIIHLPGMAIIIDNTCSGLRSLISLVALATLWTALLPAAAPRWQKLTMVAASIPIALAANLVRILVLVTLAVWAGPAVAEGFIHYGSGLVVFGVALAALVGASRLLTGRARASRGAG